MTTDQPPSPTTPPSPGDRPAGSGPAVDAGDFDWPDPFEKTPLPGQAAGEGPTPEPGPASDPRVHPPGGSQAPKLLLFLGILLAALAALVWALSGLLSTVWEPGPQADGSRPALEATAPGEEEPAEARPGTEATPREPGAAPAAKQKLLDRAEELAAATASLKAALARDPADQRARERLRRAVAASLAITRGLYLGGAAADAARVELELSRALGGRLGELGLVEGMVIEKSTSRTFTGPGGDRVLLVTGRVRNQGGQRLTAGVLRAILVDDENRVVARAFGYAGRRVTREEVGRRPADQLRGELLTPPQASEALGPDQSLPFALVFSPMPAGAARYKVAALLTLTPPGVNGPTTKE